MILKVTLCWSSQLILSSLYDGRLILLYWRIQIASPTRFLSVLSTRISFERILYFNRLSFTFENQLGCLFLFVIGQQYRDFRKAEKIQVENSNLIKMLNSMQIWHHLISRCISSYLGLGYEFKTIPSWDLSWNCSILIQLMEKDMSLSHNLGG